MFPSSASQPTLLYALLLVSISTCWPVRGSDGSGDGAEDVPSIKGLTGQVSNVRIAVPAAQPIEPVPQTERPADIDLKRMAQWAMHYLIHTPRAEFNYEPVFQCHPLRCPPIPAHADPVVSCDTDSRLDWEWYFMREISGSQAGRDVEAAFHRRVRDYIDPQGFVFSSPGAYYEGQTDRVWKPEEYIFHTWGATKILRSLALEYSTVKDIQSKERAREVFLGLRQFAASDANGRCWFPQGMGGCKADGTVVPNGWNKHPAPIVEPLIAYSCATGDSEGLEFARAYTEGIIHHSQPDGLLFHGDGSFDGHSHATMHALWGVAHLGLIDNNQRYLDFVERSWQFMLSRGTGTGWFPAGPDCCNETCCISDMMSIAAILGRSGKTEYFDYVERYMRNYISNLQFIVTPQFETYYRSLHQHKAPHEIEAGLLQIRKFQGGIIGGSGLNDYENVLLGGISGFEMFGCCAPEGMRAIHTTWNSIIDRLPPSQLGPEGVYVNLGLSRQSPWGEVVSFFPQQGRLTVVPTVEDTFYLRPPHWVPRSQVSAFVGNERIPGVWSGDYIRFDAKPGQELTITYPLISFSHEVAGLWPVSAPDLRIRFEWLGNMVVSSDPSATKTPLFSGKPRVLPDYQSASGQ